MSDSRRANIRRLTRVFQLLVGAALAVIGFLVLQPLWTTEFRMGFFTVRGLQTISENELAYSQRVLVVGLAALPDLCWMYGLVQLLGVSRWFIRAEFFTEAVIGRFRRFGWALVVMAATEVICTPAVIAYLVWLAKIDPPDNWWRYVISGEALNSLLAAVLILIVSAILRIAMQIHEESQLTI